MNYALATLWHDRQRYIPGILAVSFSALLIALQCGLLLGLFSVTSLPIDHTRADIWVGAPQVLSVDLGEPISESLVSRLSSHPSLHPEVYIQSFARWRKLSGGMELCIVIGSRLDDEALGSVDELTPALREKLTQPGAVVVDESELGRLGVRGVGDTPEINGVRVRVVGLVKGLKSIAGPYVFCSVSTARMVMRFRPDQSTYLLIRCPGATPEARRAEAARIVAELKPYGDMAAFTSQEFSRRSQIHWLTKTKAGIALGYAALLGLVVGAVVTSQTLFAATMASIREYAILLALGIPRWRLSYTVVTQAFWIGVVGVLLALPATYLFAEGADLLGAKVLLPPELLAGSGVVTMFMALLSGLAALRSLRQIEPVNLLR